VTEIGKGFAAAGFCGDSSNCWINNWPALTIPFMATAVSIFLLRQHFASIPDELWDAARMDGAGHVRFLIQIVLPISRAALFVVILFAFIGAWNELAWALLVTNGPEWRPISVGLQNFFDDEQGFANLRMAGSMIAILPILLLYAVTQRTFIEGLSQSGLKG
jgi:ABC-type glycerol-3-phosphate transport system permease component